MKRLLLGSLLSCMLVGQVVCADNAIHIPKERAFVAISTLVGLGVGLINKMPATTMVGAFTTSSALAYLANRENTFFNYMLGGALSFATLMAANGYFKS